ncbi:DUF6883 domain-containing protein [Gloeothece verrucosa]|uniref:DUF6883 domain-containing protein n=1 Tax=Gloeothece verrucosa (strain PCC 7822) TaxID=497965 RepID=E0UNM4_GLOV7|nr:DUF6883 domain-containing protein [Gloeothece verrucosa]ADN18554.1 conserved hypothetical protein [Gloeothece verrucosa PCC 7822]
MKLPQPVIIPDDKLTKYLLIYREQDDKSKFLSQAGFTHANPETLKNSLLELVSTTEAIEDITNEYGTFYRVEGEIIGISSKKLAVITIWLKRKIDNQIQFITLKPKKEKRPNA